MANIFVTKKGSITKGDPKAIIEIASESDDFKRIRRWGNSKGKKYIAVIYEIEGDNKNER